MNYLPSWFKFGLSYKDSWRCFTFLVIIFQRLSFKGGSMRRTSSFFISDGQIIWSLRGRNKIRTQTGKQVKEILPCISLSLSLEALTLSLLETSRDTFEDFMLGQLERTEESLVSGPIFCASSFSAEAYFFFFYRKVFKGPFSLDLRWWVGLQ